MSECHSCRNCGTSLVSSPVVATDIADPVISLDGTVVSIIVPGITSRLVALMVTGMKSSTCSDCYETLVLGLARFTAKKSVVVAPVVIAPVEEVVEPTVEATSSDVVADKVDEPIMVQKSETESAKLGQRMVKMAMAIKNGERLEFSGKLDRDGQLLTECVVHSNAPNLCVCGGWHDWAVMPALAFHPEIGPCYGFGPACAAKISKYSTVADPFVGAKTYMDEVTSRQNRLYGEHRVAPVSQTLPVRPAKEISVVQKLRNILSLTVEPSHRHFDAAKTAKTFADRYLGARDAFKAYAIAPNNENRLKIIAYCDIRGMVMSGADLHTVAFTKSDAEVISKVCHGYGMAAGEIAKDLQNVLPMVRSPESVAEAAQERAKREAKKAAQRLADATLRQSMKGSSGGGGGQKKSANGKKK